MGFPKVQQQPVAQSMRQQKPDESRDKCNKGCVMNFIKWGNTSLEKTKLSRDDITHNHHSSPFFHFENNTT